MIGKKKWKTYREWSSNFHSSQHENRCWTGILNFNYRFVCNSFVCETIFVNVPILRKPREKSAHVFETRLRIWSRIIRSQFPRKFVRKRPSSALERKLFADAAFIDMDDVTAGRCVLLSRSSNWNGSRCYMPGVMHHIFLLLVKNFRVKSIELQWIFLFFTFVYMNEIDICIMFLLQL